MFVPKPLYVVRAGIQYSRPGYQTGPKVMMWHMLVVVLKGKGWLKTEKGDWPLRTGDAFCVFPAGTISYGTDPADLFVSAWVGFLGTETEAVLAHIGFTPTRPVINIYPAYDRVAALIHQIREELIAKKDDYMLRCAGLLWQVCGSLGNAAGGTTTCCSDTSLDIQQVAAYIDANFADINSITELATTLGYSRSYLVRKFKESTGITPHDYLIMRRMAAAKHLLCETNMSVKTIAYSVGYHSNHYFSRDFTTRIGGSPTEFRRQHQATPNRR